jgi:hypothetical protein
MKKEKFRALIQDGHKEAAAEVPFNPVVKWHIPDGQLWHGRRGYKVEGTLNGTAFDSVIVPRARSFFLIIDNALLKAAGAAAGEIAEIMVVPRRAETT